MNPLQFRVSNFQFPISVVVKLIVGLGNPGYEYHLTPHNLGFMAVDRLAEDCGVDVGHREAQSLVASARIEGEDVLLAKPQTYMNLSGLAVAPLLESHGLCVEDLIVLLDEVDLPLGHLRIRTRGSAGRHNGLKSVLDAVGGDRFVRVRLGAGPTEAVEDRAAYVLGPFRKADLGTVAEMLDRASEAVHVILKEGPQKAMNRFNRRASSEEL